MKKGLFPHFFPRSFWGLALNKVGGGVIVNSRKAINSLFVLLRIPFCNFDVLLEINLYSQHTNEK